MAAWRRADRKTRQTVLAGRRRIGHHALFGVDRLRQRCAGEFEIGAKDQRPGATETDRADLVARDFRPRPLRRQRDELHHRIRGRDSAAYGKYIGGRDKPARLSGEQCACAFEDTAHAQIPKTERNDRPRTRNFAPLSIILCRPTDFRMCNDPQTHAFPRGIARIKPESRKPLAKTFLVGNRYSRKWF